MTFGEEVDTPDFLPKKPFSSDELKTAVHKNLDAVLGLIPPLPSKDLDLHNLEEVKAGMYKLDARPTAEFLKTLPDYKGGTAEVGIFCIRGKWFVSLNDDLETGLPETIAAINNDGVFQADIHTHPGTDPGAYQPSMEDVSHLDSTIDGINHIISNKGLIQYGKPEKMPYGLQNVNYVRKAWSHWINDELKMTKDEFEKIGGWEMGKRFYEKFFGLRTIPWENAKEIDSILAAKEKLTTETK